IGGRDVDHQVTAAYVEAVEEGSVATRHTAVVGRLSRPTHLVNSKIYEVILNHYWTAPRSIVEKEIMPLMRKDPTYLEKNAIRLL
ncbi:L,D-transpeptidase family protein, partial [Rhizobium leguminosarum]|uniref:L,D-transpeptidase family protein n=1 Tax=Rhizobium leguminosarum TaxID=384 RepID=UPI003F9CDB70